MQQRQLDREYVVVSPAALSRSLKGRRNCTKEELAVFGCHVFLPNYGALYVQVESREDNKSTLLPVVESLFREWSVHSVDCSFI